MNDDTKSVIKTIHDEYLKNPYDESDILFYRINYKLENLLHLKREEAGKLHNEYHQEFPRSISLFFCSNCNAIVKFIPVLYYSTIEEKQSLRTKEKEGNVFLIPSHQIAENSPLFVCKICKSSANID